jgi:hypothetical protein
MKLGERGALTASRVPSRLIYSAGARRVVQVAGWAMTAASLLTPFPGWPSMAISAGFFGHGTATNERVKPRSLRR